MSIELLAIAIFFLLMGTVFAIMLIVDLFTGWNLKGLPPLSPKPRK